jgi:hypothetical protein
VSSPNFYCYVAANLRIVAHLERVAKRISATIHFGLAWLRFSRKFAARFRGRLG